MKLIRTHVPEVEYELLRKAARTEGKTVQDWIRTAIREKLLPDKVDPSDPLFAGFPLVRRKGPKVEVAVRNDDLLYGSGH